MDADRRGHGPGERRYMRPGPHTVKRAEQNVHSLGDLCRVADRSDLRPGRPLHLA